MDLQSYARILRKRWRIITVVTLLVLALAMAFTYLSPKQYESKVQFFVSTAAESDAAALAQGGDFSQQRVKSYSELITSPKVLQPVIDELKLDEDAGALAEKITAKAPVDTVLIDVAVQNGDPDQAQKIAQSVGKQFPKTVQEIETVSSSKESPVKVTVTRSAVVDTAPVAPRPLRNAVLALALGLLLGLAAAVGRHLLDSKVRTKEDVEDLTSASMIGGIPFDPDARTHPLVAHTDTHSSRAEAFRSLRTNLQFVDVANHPRVIVVTSSLAGEGKTTTAANLAGALAESGASVCVIEGDLRRPRLLSYLGLEGGVGLTDVLIERTELDDVLQPFGKHRLVVLGAGQIPPNPSELLGSPAMRETLSALRERYDYVIIDAPPLLPVTDAAVLSTLADGAVMVSGSGVVSRDQLSTAVESLRQVNGQVLGVVLNLIPRRSTSGYYDYRYEYRSAPTKPAAGSRRSERNRNGSKLRRRDKASAPREEALAPEPEESSRGRRRLASLGRKTNV